MRALLLLAVVAGVLAGCAGDESSGKPLTVGEVRRAYATVGVHLRSERLDAKDPCTSPAYVTGVDPDSVGCASVVIPVKGGKPPNARMRHSIVTLWSERDRQRWVIFLYKDEDTASTAEKNAGTFQSTIETLLPDNKISRVKNALLVYTNPADEIRFRSALSTS